MDNIEINIKDKIETAIEIMKKYDVPKPVFSDSWIKNFMQRNRLSWRTAHYARRSAIDYEYADIYINLVAEAVSKYGWSHVFNMDETSVRLNNGSKRTIAPIGIDVINIDCKRNDKECFTCIGTCTSTETKKLIILAKGGDKSCCKFHGGKNVEVWPTNNQNGWVTESIMVKYLRYLAKNWANNEPCALILDCFKAHHTPEVIKVAAELNINLIFVPANGTSLFQPLDRFIFGVVKSKMRSLAKSDILSGKERFEIITKHLLDSWNSITPNVLKAAWNLPKLEQKIQSLAQGQNAIFLYYIESFGPLEEDLPDNYNDRYFIEEEEDQEDDIWDDADDIE